MLNPSLKPLTELGYTRAIRGIPPESVLVRAKSGTSTGKIRVKSGTNTRFSLYLTSKLEYLVRYKVAKNRKIIYQGASLKS